jgi:hypothetical protein
MLLHDAFVQAMQNLRLCILKDKGGNSRVVQPYGVFLTRDRKPMYCCFQVAGYTGSGSVPNWRNFPISDIEEVLISERSFKRREDFNPDNTDVYHQWVERIH